MLFNSIQFFLFILVVYGLYLILSHRWQNRMLLAASCFFYGAWDVRFLLLMFVSITADFLCGPRIYYAKDRQTAKLFLSIALTVNLAILLFFKYCNFFVSNFTSLLNYCGLTVNPCTLEIVLPIGISFYTFQAMSYSFDLYRREVVPPAKYLDYALFVTYFPQLVAGPIMKAKDLLPQVLKERIVTAEKFKEGCFWILWGLFQKVYVADNLAGIVEPVFSSASPRDGLSVLLAVYAFAFQIYCDFAGYSNIAKGLGKIMGFDIITNFNLPYFATNPVEFWKRWHISLSSWLRDYLYIPLGGNRQGRLRTFRNLGLTMLIGGLWHGASWTFVLWGAYQGTLLIAYRAGEPLWHKLRSLTGQVPRLSGLFYAARLFLFFHLICLGWLVFRAQSFEQIFIMLKSIATGFLPVDQQSAWQTAAAILQFTWFLVLIEIMQYHLNDLKFILRQSPLVKAGFSYICFLLLIFYGAEGTRQFIYFQF